MLKVELNQVPVNHVLIWESELRVLAGMCARWGSLETGGSLYGFWTRRGQPVVSLVAGPGPKAIHETARFSLDLEFTQRTTRIIKEALGLDFVGNAHSHHSLGLRRPSSVDVRQATSLARLNEIPKLVGIIMSTRADEDRGFLSWLWPTRPHGEPAGTVRVSLNPFIFRPEGTYAACQVRVLRGVSPMREAVMARGILDPDAICEYVCGFPLDQIDVPLVGPDKYRSDEKQGPLNELCRQIQALPAPLQKDLQLHAHPGVVAVSIGLDSSRKAFIAVEESPPHKVLGAYLGQTDNGEPADVTQQILTGGNSTSLGQAVQMLMAMPAGEPVQDAVSCPPHRRDKPARRTPRGRRPRKRSERASRKPSRPVAGDAGPSAATGDNAQAKDAKDMESGL